MKGNTSIYGSCERCDGKLHPIWFTEEEIINGVPTGRKRRAVSHLECDGCGKKYCVDDSFDGPWR